MVQPTALNFVIIGMMVLIFNFMMRLAAGWLIQRNPDSELGAALGSLTA